MSQVAIAQNIATHVADIPTRTGLHKLLLFCSKARSYHCCFAWSDTCCINKDSNAELDESIRSMFRWYHNAFICIVHLASSLVMDDIPADEWFTRGWTLQELLAPENMKFYNREWKPFTEAENDKDKRNHWLPEEGRSPIWRAILAVTRIPSIRLGFFSPGPFDVAQRLSWAAGRRTTRIEDIAYALVGIFGINMPVQYGEGKFAFQRLTEALLQRVRDNGIFVWTGPASQYSAALPASIDGYLAAKEAEDSVSVPNSFGDPSMTLTHKGLQVEVLLVPMQCREADDDRSEEEIDSSQDVEERSHHDTNWGEHHEGSGSGNDRDDLIIVPEDTCSSSDSEGDELRIRFLGNDEEYQSSNEGRFSWFHFTDPDNIFKPLSIRGRGPVVFFDTLMVSDGPPRQYACAILDYHRDWARGPRCVYVPYSEKPRYLAFVLYRDDSGEVWSKLWTDVLVYVEVEAEKMYESQTVSICL